MPSYSTPSPSQETLPAQPYSQTCSVAADPLASQASLYGNAFMLEQTSSGRAGTQWASDPSLLPYYELLNGPTVAPATRAQAMLEYRNLELALGGPGHPARHRRGVRRAAALAVVGHAGHPLPAVRAPRPEPRHAAARARPVRARVVHAAGRGPYRGAVGRDAVQRRGARGPRRFRGRLDAGAPGRAPVGRVEPIVVVAALRGPPGMGEAGVCAWAMSAEGEEGERVEHERSPDTPLAGTQPQQAFAQFGVHHLSDPPRSRSPSMRRPPELRLSSCRAQVAPPFVRRLQSHARIAKGIPLSPRRPRHRAPCRPPCGGGPLPPNRRR